TGQERARLDFRLVHEVKSLAFDPTGNILVVGCRDGFIELCDLSASPPRRSRFKAHQTAVRSLAFSADGTMFASGADGGDAPVKLWKWGHRAEPLKTVSGTRGRIPGAIIDIAFAPDAKTLAVLAGMSVRSARLALWDTSDETKGPLPLAEGDGSFTSVTF